MAVGAATALAAYQAGSMGVGLSGGGFLIPFILGALNMLYIELGILKYNMPVAGGSTGAIAATVASGLIPMNSMRKQVASVAEHCRSNLNCYGNLADKVNFSAQKLLGPDSAKQAQKQGNVYISLTYPAPLGIGPPEHRLVTNFTSKADLVSAIDASSYIPLWSGPRVTTNFRGERVYDGSLGGKDLPCPPGVAYCLKIDSMPIGTSLTKAMLDSIASNRPEEAVSASGFWAKTIAALPGNLANTIATYASGDLLDAVSDIAQFQQMVVAMTAPPPPPGHVAAASVGGNASKADIWPGRRHPLPVSENTWVSWMMEPADADGRAAMFELGRAEALTWAQEQGFAAANGRKLTPPADAYRAAEAAQSGAAGGSAPAGITRYEQQELH